MIKALQAARDAGFGTAGIDFAIEFYSGKPPPAPSPPTAPIRVKGSWGEIGPGYQNRHYVPHDYKSTNPFR